MRLAAALAACLLMAGCEGGGIDFEGGLHDLLERGIDVTIYSVPTVTKPAVHVPIGEKVGPPTILVASPKRSLFAPLSGIRELYQGAPPCPP